MLNIKLKNTPKGLGPLSARGTVVLLALLYLLLVPVRTQFDIVSAGLAYGSLVVVALALLLVGLHGALLERRIAIEVLPPETPVVSGAPARIVIHLTPTRILPFTYLDLSIDFEHPLPKPAVVRVTGSALSERRIHLDLTFPHRGRWDISAVRCELRDRAGLTRHTWIAHVNSSVVVTPPTVAESHLPILSSTQRPGDLVVDNFNRRGDPFDIKAYHPSDGVKKIVWKAFAKRGELLSRHPEASMSPEGYVVILVLAGPHEDQVCSRAIAYATTLNELKLDTVIGCQGGAGATPATTPADAESLLIDTVWRSSDPSKQSLQADTSALLDYCSQTALGITVKKLIIFCSGDRVSNRTETDAISELAQWLHSQGTTPVFCLTPPSRQTPVGVPSTTRALSGWFMLPQRSQLPSLSLNVYNDFLSGCLQKQWEVFV